MQSVALGKRKILLEAWQTHFIRDLVTSKIRTLHQVSLKHQGALQFGRDTPFLSILSTSFFAFLMMLLAMVKSLLLKNILKEMTYWKLATLKPGIVILLTHLVLQKLTCFFLLTWSFLPHFHYPPLSYSWFHSFSFHRTHCLQSQ